MGVSPSPSEGKVFLPNHFLKLHKFVFLSLINDDLKELQREGLEIPPSAITLSYAKVWKISIDIFLEIEKASL